MKEREEASVSAFRSCSRVNNLNSSFRYGLLKWFEIQSSMPIVDFDVGRPLKYRFFNLKQNRIEIEQSAENHNTQSKIRLQTDPRSVYRQLKPGKLDHGLLNIAF